MKALAKLNDIPYETSNPMQFSISQVADIAFGQYPPHRI